MWMCGYSVMHMNANFILYCGSIMGELAQDKFPTRGTIKCALILILIGKHLRAAYMDSDSVKNKLTPCLIGETLWDVTLIRLVCDQIAYVHVTAPTSSETVLCAVLPCSALNLYGYQMIRWKSCVCNTAR